MRHATLRDNKSRDQMKPDRDRKQRNSQDSEETNGRRPERGRTSAGNKLDLRDYLAFFVASLQTIFLPLILLLLLLVVVVALLFAFL